MATMRQTELHFDPGELERKWQARWQESGVHSVRDDDPRPKWYELTMYPYPSGDLHIGHWYAMAPSDAHARFRRMQGYNVLHPMGFDAFGLPAENAAIKRGIHPYAWTMSNIENMRRQLRSMGPVYDWGREIVCCLPEYYRWNQWLFLKLYEAGLAYRAMAAANWCDSCQTTLATGTPWPPPTPTPASAACKGTTCSIPWGSTPLACRQRTPPSSAAFTPTPGR